MDTTTKPIAVHVFDELRQQVWRVSQAWNLFRRLSVECSEAELGLLNQRAALVFATLQFTLADHVTLSLVKFFDKDRVAGQDTVSLSQAIKLAQQQRRAGAINHTDDPIYIRALTRRGVADADGLISALEARFTRMRRRISPIIEYRNRVLAHCDLKYVTGDVDISPPVIRTINRLVRWVHLFYNDLSLIYDNSTQSPEGLKKRAARAVDDLMRVLDRGNHQLDQERLQRRQEYLARHRLRDDQVPREFDPGENAPDR